MEAYDAILGFKEDFNITLENVSIKRKMTRTKQNEKQIPSFPLTYVKTIERSREFHSHYHVLIDNYLFIIHILYLT